MRIRQAREISPILRSGILAAVVPLVIRFMPLPRVLAMLEPKQRSLERLFSTKRLVQIANGAVRRGPRFGVGECFIRSLVLYSLLRRFAYEPVLLIGGRLSGGAVASHSWIEVDGEPIGEREDPRHVFSVLYRYGMNAGL